MIKLQKYTVNWIVLRSEIDCYEKSKETMKRFLDTARNYKERYYQPKKSESFLGIFEENHIVEKVKI